MKTLFFVTILFLLSSASVVWISAVTLLDRAPQVIHVTIDTPGHPRWAR